MMNPEQYTAEARKDSLLAEIREEIESRSRLLLSSVKGQLFWLQKTQSDLNASPVAWVLRAHEGTLEKTICLFAAVDPSRGVELVSLARNLFENLIWLKLFNRSSAYGLLFYRQLLQSQIHSQEQAIAQAQAEIATFEEAGKRDTLDLTPVEHILNKAGEPTEEERAAVRAHIDASQRRLDDEIRRSFSVYGHQATYNGYEMQAYLLKNDVIPQHIERKRVNEVYLAELNSTLNVQVDSTLLADFNARWNWAQRAEAVGMSAQYRFIYSYTSRLLNATPMNIITPKQLDDHEREVLLDYIRTGILDAHASIEQFSYPGQIKLAFIDLENAEGT
jgi:hypothetical protein